MLEYLYDVRSCILKLILLHIGNVSQYTVIFKRKKKEPKNAFAIFKKFCIFFGGGAEIVTTNPII